MDLSERSQLLVARHPWEIARFDFFFRVLHAHSLLSRGNTVLDAGAGDAWFASQIVAKTHAAVSITCWDCGYTDALMRELGEATNSRLRLCRDRPSSQFSLITVLDVLEHVENDRQFLRELVEQNLLPDGSVLISVPAWQSLFSAHDLRLRHFRRYSPALCKSTIDYAGLRPIACGGLFHCLLVPRAIQAFGEKLVGTREQQTQNLSWDHGKLLTRTVRAVLSLDSEISYHLAGLGFDVPGMSWWALCKKR